MSLDMPKLDDRTFQQLVNEAKSQITRYCPKWTDHNVSDPGVTLIELFAHMVETMIYRLNRVPEKSYIAFMDLMGVRLQEGAAARADLTFWLTETPATPMIIRRGTEVTTVQTPGADAVTFSTDQDLTVYPPLLRACLTSPEDRSEGQQFAEHTGSLANEVDVVPVFDPQPRPGNAFYLGFESNLSSHIVRVNFDIRAVTGISIDPKNPPLVWEARCTVRANEDVWLPCELASEGTGGLNTAGAVTLFVPPRMVQQRFGAHERYWLRCRYVGIEGGKAGYSRTPQIHGITAESLGGTVSATQAITYQDEVVGRSAGLPGQRVRLEHPPVLPPQAAQGERVEVQSREGVWEPWDEVPHFGGSLPGSTHYTLDRVSGEICFGPTMREPDGSERQYGAVPPAGSAIRMRRYRSGGGELGNLAAQKISVLKTTIPYVASVLNRRSSEGGRDSESLEQAMRRAPQVLRTRFRAVTAEDYEYLALESTRSVARVRCLQPTAIGAAGMPAPGAVRVLVVPSVKADSEQIRPEQLRLLPQIEATVRDYLDERRLLTTALEIAMPAYTYVAVRARLRARPQADLSQLQREAESRLYRFLSPISGGPGGDGWPFGRDLYLSEIYAVLQGVPGVEFVEAARLSIPGREGAPQRITLGPDGLIASELHQVEVIR